MRRLLQVHGVVLMFGLVGCRRGELAAGVSDSSFVATMAELRRVSRETTLDSAQRVAARGRVLQGRGLTAERLEAAARALANDPERAQALWTAVEQRVNRPAPPLVRPTPATPPPARKM